MCVLVTLQKTATVIFISCTEGVMYSLGAKKAYLEFAQTRVKPVIHFYGFNRNIMMQDIRYDKKDKLTQLFAEVQYDLEELYEVN